MVRPTWWRSQPVLSNRSAYICPACRHASSKSLINTSSQPQRTRRISGAEVRSGGSNIHTRYYGKTQNLAAKTFEGQKNINTTEHSSLHYPESNSTKTPKESLSHSRVRSSLRAWAARNEASKRANAPENIQAEGRIRQLPNALFTGKSHHEEDFKVDIGTLADSTPDEYRSGASSVLKPGTLLWHGISDRPGEYAVYIGNLGVQNVLALESGNWTVLELGSLRGETFAFQRPRIPNFLRPEDLEQLKQCVPKSVVARPIGGSEAISEISATGLMPRELTETFMAAVHSFRQDVDAHLRRFAENYEGGYSRVAFERDYRSMTMNEFLAEGYNIDWDSTTPAEKMAISHHLAELDSVTTYQTANDLSVLVMSKTMRHELEQVVGWARKYQDAASQAALGRDVTLLLSENPLTAFIDKARRLILTSRKTRSPTSGGGLGPSAPTGGVKETKPQKVSTGVEFTSTDRAIISFVWTTSCRLPGGTLNGPLKLMPVTSLILRAVGAYPDLILDRSIARLFLKEIGCLDPWDIKAHDMALPLLNGKASHKTDALYSELEVYAQAMEESIASGRFSDLDTMAHMRKRWTLPAFAVDPKEAGVLEDAFSIERATELDGGHWIHIHVPHVAAFFEPGSIVERFARNKGFNAFSVDKSIASDMLPRALREILSLKHGTPVITVSTLIASDGSSVDVKMTAGVIENFVRVSSDALNAMLGLEETSLETRSVLLVGKIAEPKPEAPDAHDMAVVARHKIDLESLAKVLQQRTERRLQELPGKVSIPRLNFEVNVSTTHSGPSDSKREQQSYHWKGDPAICLTGRHLVNTETDIPRNTSPVAQATRLAAESTARWLEARHIPAIYIGTEAAADNSFDQIASKKPYERFRPPVYLRSTTPLPYWDIHLRSFCAFTSPLRRYVDLLAQWQVTSYLKAEAAGAVQPNFPLQDESLLSFTKKQIEEYLRYDAHATDTVYQALLAVRATYAFQALFRAFHFKEAPLPAEWEVLIQAPAKLSAGLDEHNAFGKLIPFDLSCEILPDPAGWSKMARFGQYLPVKIEAVNPDKHVVQCIATGMPTNEQTLLKSFNAISERTPRAVA